MEIFGIFVDEFERDRRSSDRRNRDCRNPNYRPPSDVNWMTIVDLLGTNSEYVIPTFENGDGTNEPSPSETGAPSSGGGDGGGGWGR
jgi:hypothetical protein